MYASDGDMRGWHFWSETRIVRYTEVLRWHKMM